MSSRRARVDGLNEDLSTLSRKVEQLYGDLEAVVDAIETNAEQAENRPDSGNESQPDEGHVGWEEVETAGPTGEQAAESVAWTPVETE